MTCLTWFIHLDMKEKERANMVIKQTTSTKLSKPVILVIMSFLGIALIFGSPSTLQIFAQNNYRLENIQCSTDRMNDWFDNETCCWDQYNANSGAYQGWFCQACTLKGSQWGNEAGERWTCENVKCPRANCWWGQSTTGNEGIITI